MVFEKFRQETNKRWEGTVRAKIASAIVQISDEARAKKSPFLCIECLFAYILFSTRTLWACSMVALLVWQRQKDFVLRDWPFARLLVDFQTEIHALKL